MCGRFTRNYTWAEIRDYFGLMSQPANIQPSFNVCPTDTTDTIDTVLATDRGRILAPMRWGLIPSWWSKPLKEFRAATFNARDDKVLSSKVWQKPFREIAALSRPPDFTNGSRCRSR